MINEWELLCGAVLPNAENVFPASCSGAVCRRRQVETQPARRFNSQYPWNRTYRHQTIYSTSFYCIFEQYTTQGVFIELCFFKPFGRLWTRFVRLTFGRLQYRVIEITDNKSDNHKRRSGLIKTPAIDGQAALEGIIVRRCVYGCGFECGVILIYHGVIKGN